MGEIRLAVRSLLKTKLFTAVAILTLMIGIGATTAVFSVYDAVALRPLPFAEPDRLVDIEEWSATKLCSGCGVGVSAPMVADIERRSKTLQSIILYTETGVNVGGRDAPERVSAAGVSGNFFGTLGITATLGRAIDRTDALPGAPRVAVLSERLFQRRFGGDRSAVGQVIRVNGQPTTVVGVMPRTAVLPDFAQIWLPIEHTGFSTHDRSVRELGVIGRLKDGATVIEADRELKQIAADLERAYPETQAEWSARARVLREAIGDDDRQPFAIMLGAVGVLWAVVCANLAALLLARGIARRKEVAVRLALGGSRTDIVWHLFAESLLIALAGGVIGAVAASWVVDGILLSLGSTIPSWLTPRVDGTVLGFCVLLSIVSAAAFGMFPAFRASRASVHEELKSGSSSGGGEPRTKLRGGLVVLQLSLSMLLLALAGVFSATIASRSRYDDTRNADVLQARMEMLGEVSGEQITATATALTARLAALPEARSAAVEAAGFIAGFGGNDERIKVEGIPAVADGLSPRFFHSVTSGFFETMGVRVVEGRALSASDGAASPRVAVINRNLAVRLWPGGSAIGKRIKLGHDSLQWTTIVGVVADPDEAATRVDNTAYVPFAQSPIGGFTVLVAAKTNPVLLARPVREVARSVAPDLPLLDLMTLADAHASRWRPLRSYATLISSVGGIALLLAAIGLYGIVAYNAQRRTREIGVRIALGAARGDVIRLVTRQGMTLVGLGITFGLISAALVTPVMRGLLFGARPFNPGVYAAAAAVLLVVAVVASYLPARRAAATDPMVALRND